MNLVPFFKVVQIVQPNSEFYSPLFSTIKFVQVRHINLVDENSPFVLEFKTVGTNSTILFNEEGKPLVYHQSGEMIYETNLGECMVFPSETERDWETFCKPITDAVQSIEE